MNEKQFLDKMDRIFKEQCEAELMELEADRAAETAQNVPQDYYEEHSIPEIQEEEHHLQQEHVFGQLTVEFRQAHALKQLNDALKQATACGLLDKLCGDLHPDYINAFCDAVSDAVAEFKLTDD